MSVTATRRRKPVDRAPTSRSSRRAAPLVAPQDYAHYSATPWASLLFILPLLLLHEIGIALYGGLPPASEHRITAFVLMARFFDRVGATAPFLPAMAIITILLMWHIATEEGGLARGGWNIRPRAIFAMGAESLAWAVPLIGIYYIFGPSQVQFAPAGDRKLMASLYLGAGIYEEAAFRLAGFALLSLLLVDVSGLTTRWATPIVVLAAAIGFSAYHLLGDVGWPWQAFVFTGLRGVYYGIIFIERGFGVTVGVHTTYDLLYLLQSDLVRR